MLLIIWLAALALALVLYCRKTYSRFSRHGVKTLTPVPLFGDMTRIAFGLEHIFENTQRIYESFPGERFVGFYEFIRPVVMIRDLEVVKKVTVKDFEHFIDHSIVIDDNADTIFGNNLFVLKGQKWKDMRSTISPAFTSSKMKFMVPFMIEAGNHIINRINRIVQESGKNYIDVDTKDLCTRYANDVVASCAFGLHVNSQKYPENEFYMMGKSASKMGLVQGLKFLGFQSLPRVMKLLKINFFPESVRRFFTEVVLHTMKRRESLGIYRPDMIHLLMEAKKGNLVYEEDKILGTDLGFAAVEESAIGKKANKRVWSDDELVSQVAVFFLAGFDSVASAMAMLLYELAINPDVQEKLVEEIRENHKKNNGKFDGSSIQQLRYLDMVVSEMLRLWTPGGMMDRVCTKDYNLGKPNDNATDDYIIRKGEGVRIPVWAFHRNPEYFPNPTKFDPERFSPENCHKIHPYAYSPFGIGPRNCVGSRFALCEVKVMIYQLLQHVELCPCEKTTVPAELVPRGFNILIKGGNWVRLRLRQ